MLTGSDSYVDIRSFDDTLVEVKKLYISGDREAILAMPVDYLFHSKQSNGLLCRHVLEIDFYRNIGINTFADIVSRDDILLTSEIIGVLTSHSSPYFTGGREEKEALTIVGKIRAINSILNLASGVDVVLTSELSPMIGESAVSRLQEEVHIYTLADLLSQDPKQVELRRIIYGYRREQTPDIRLQLLYAAMGQYDRIKDTITSPI